MLIENRVLGFLICMREGKGCCDQFCSGRERELVTWDVRD